MKPLSTIPKSTAVFILRIDPNADIAEHLDAELFQPKQLLTVLSNTRGTLQVEVRHQRVTLDKSVAEHIYVSEVLNDLEQAFEGNQTKQREAILTVLKRTKGHFTLDELTAKVQRVYPRIGQVTVYRALKTLTANSILEEFIMPDGTRKYEVRRGYHDHIICEGCGSIYDFYDEDLEALHRQIASKHGVLLERRKMQLFGQQCPRCVQQATTALA